MTQHVCLSKGGDLKLRHKSIHSIFNILCRFFFVFLKENMPHALCVITLEDSHRHIFGPWKCAERIKGAATELVE